MDMYSVTQKNHRLRKAFASRLAPTIGTGYICQKLVGYKAAIAGKPAPTGFWYIRNSNGA
jgi:hypothetical protein